MRHFLLATASGVALAAGVVGWLRFRRNNDRHQPQQRRGELRGLAPDGSSSLDNSTITRRFLLYFIVPLWQMAGIADWICHRATNIEGTTGAKESLMHLLMLTEVRIPVLAGFYMEVTAPVAALMMLAFVIHDITALWDVSYAVTRREVTPIEQHVHSFLEMVPLMAISFIAVLHWPQFRALLGMGREPADLSIRLKDEPLPPRYIPAALGSMPFFEVLPYIGELARTLSAAHGRLVPAEPVPKPSC